MANEDMWNDTDGATEERVAFQARLRDLVLNETNRRRQRARLAPVASPNTLNPTSPAAKELHLQHLAVAIEAAAELGPILTELVDGIAERAGRAGAGYPELAQAASLNTRQAARQRWPKAVGTGWRLYTLRHGLDGAEVARFRSREKAINRGRYALLQGQMNASGDYAAVVVDNFDDVIWACHFDPATYDLAETALPDDLITAPAQDSDQHAPWVNAWTTHVHRATGQSRT
ncbi:hypothetical protein GCM10012285_66040 [Streptomyces kronopolitis]|uniref:Uncharacterized protein n=1 Tax=Streptomyces kronopolitis TaxID=1612435 RepID=A0ABQ2K1I8_9ACTN|nr:hypothetical protein [Streptomyces kronopolitis]GGN64198.1 hypothetical protein GCM10012285_66040 [Streptomyces kronopolitis]